MQAEITVKGKSLGEIFDLTLLAPIKPGPPTAATGGKEQYTRQA